MVYLIESFFNGGFRVNILKKISFFLFLLFPFLRMNATQGKEKSFHVIYSSEYELGRIGFFDLATHFYNLRSYDGIAKKLVEKGVVPKNGFVQPLPVTEKQIQSAHDQNYISEVMTSPSKKLAQIMEFSPIAKVSDFLIKRYLLKPILYGIGGTVLAVELALKDGVAINLSGGYHHASSNHGEGFCVFNDIFIAIAEARKEKPNLKVMIIDLDAHRGNGNASYKDDKTIIFDMYNQDIYPGFGDDVKNIAYCYPLPSYQTDSSYLTVLKNHLPRALDKVAPDLVIYNAGSDIYVGDKLGHQSVSAQGIIERDWLVFSQVRMRNIPFVMLLSGGYGSKDAEEFIAESIGNMLR